MASKDLPPRTKLLLLIVLAIGNFFMGSAYSILAPFFPAEAEKRGVSATVYGFIFAIFELVAFIASPVLGKYLYKLGPRLALDLGVLIEAIGVFLFGALDEIENRVAFIILAFILRIVQAIGCALFVTASFSFIAMTFPDNAARTVAILETTYGTGLVAGPPLGGLLFEAGGFSLPFLVVGGSLIILAFMSHFLIATKPTTPEPILSPPPTQEGGGTVDNGSTHSSESEYLPKQEDNSGLWILMKMPGVIIASLSIISGGINNSFVSTVLEPHIRRFHLTPLGVTGVFVALMGAYGVTCPIWGWISDNVRVTNIISLIGSLITLAGIMLIGPAAFLPLPTILWVTCVGCVLQGLGVAALYMSAFVQLTDWAKKYGFPDDLSTYGLTSGIWFSMVSLGSFIGPIMAGILFDQVGFRKGSYFCIGIHVIMIILQVGFIIYMCSSSNPIYTFTSRRTSLLQNIEGSETRKLLKESSIGPLPPLGSPLRQPLGPPIGPPIGLPVKEY